MFLILNTSVKNDTTFNCMTRTHFCKLSSDKFNLKDFQGRLVFNLDLLPGTDYDKVKDIFTSIQCDWEFDNNNWNNFVNSIVVEQKEHLAKFVLGDLYDLNQILNKSYKNNKIVEVKTSEPFNSLFKSPEFNEFGFYTLSEDFI